MGGIKIRRNVQSRDWFGLKRELELVDATMRSCIQSKERLLTEISEYLIDCGGKRIRPAVMLLSHMAVNERNVKELIPLAAAYELIHTATLIHDDINDGCGLRRGMLSPYVKFGTANSVVTGDFLFVKAFEIGARYGEEVVRITADTCCKLAEGEFLQRRNLRNLKLSEKIYLDIIQRKTALPFSAGARIGALLGNGRKETIESLAEFGFYLGTAFQIIDDILDATSTEERAGKPVNTDISQGNLTVLSIHALRNACKKERDILSNIILKKEKSLEDFKRARKIFAETGSVDYAYGLAGSYIEKAKSRLRVIPDSRHKRGLEKLADYVVEREK